MKNHSYWKKFHVKSDKKQKIFFATPVSKFQEISTLNICDGAKQIYQKKQKQKQKEDSKKRYSTKSSRAIRRFNVKKVPFIFKISPPAYLHIIKIHIE